MVYLFSWSWRCRILYNIPVFCLYLIQEIFFESVHYSHSSSRTRHTHYKHHYVERISFFALILELQSKTSAKCASLTKAKGTGSNFCIHEHRKLSDPLVRAAMHTRANLEDIKKCRTFWFLFSAFIRRRFRRLWWRKYNPVSCPCSRQLLVYTGGQSLLS